MTSGPLGRRAGRLHQREQRWAAFRAGRAERVERPAKVTRARQRASAEQARLIRASFLERL
jgi:hypothetical protein